MKRTVLIAILAFTSPVLPAQEEELRGLRMIVVGSEPEAIELRERIAAGEWFGALAHEHSVDSTATANGYLGSVRATELGDAFRTALSGLAPGEVSDVVALGRDYTLLQWLTDDEELWRELNDSGIREFAAERYTGARPHFRDAVEVARRFGNDDDRLADSLSNLATAYLRDGLYERAAPCFREVLAIRERTRPSGHPDLIRPLSDLAGTLYRLEDTDEAGVLFARVLPLAEEAFGPVHVGTSTALNNLALVLRDQGRYAEAEPLFLRAIRILETLDGPDDPGVSLVLDDLAASYRRDGRLAEAEAAASRSVRISEAVWGPDHLATGPALSGLARIRIDQGRYAEGIALDSRALGIRWGDEGRSATGGDVVAVLDAFAGAFHAARFGDDVARARFERLEAELGEGAANEDLYVAMSDLFLAATFPSEAERVILAAVQRFGSSRVRYQLAETYVRSLVTERALETFENIVPTSGAEQSFRLRRIGDLLTFLFRHDEALEAYSAALEADPASVDVQVSLGILHFSRNEPDLAAASYARAVEMDPDNVSALTRLGEIHLLLNRPDEALEAVDRALGMNSSDPRTHYVRAQALIRSGNIEEGQAVLMGYQELAARKAAEEHRTREIASYDNEVRAALERAAFDEAATVLRTAIDEFPDSDTLLLNMGIVLSRLGDHEGAIEALERRLRLGIRHDFASYMALERAAAALGDEDRRLRYRGLYLASLGPALEDTLE